MGRCAAARVLIKRSFSLAGHRTSVALEGEFWDALAALAATRGVTLAALVLEVDSARNPARNLASSLRVLVLQAAMAASRRSD